MNGLRNFTERPTRHGPLFTQERPRIHDLMHRRPVVHAECPGCAGLCRWCGAGRMLGTCDTRKWHPTLEPMVLDEERVS